MLLGNHCCHYRNVGYVSRLEYRCSAVALANNTNTNNHREQYFCFVFHPLSRICAYQKCENRLVPHLSSLNQMDQSIPPLNPDFCNKPNVFQRLISPHSFLILCGGPSRLYIPLRCLIPSLASQSMRSKLDRGLITKCWEGVIGGIVGFPITKWFLIWELS